MEDLQNYLNTIRRDFSDQPLNQHSVDAHPLTQFGRWFEEAVNAQILDPYAMSLSTVNTEGQPSNRIVYLRNVNEEGFVFYTNYKSRKAHHIQHNDKVALTFFWAEIDRQIRIEGVVKKMSKERSDIYFAQRPRESQIGAWASPQSTKIKSREELEELVTFYTQKFNNSEVYRPLHWGGYTVVPHFYEFWQGRPNRLHDRLTYTKEGKKWSLNRLAP